MKSERIINSAQELFARFGIRKTTMEDISRQARIGKSTLYYYFPAKEDIFAAVIERDCRKIRAALLKIAESSSSASEKLRSYVSMRMQHLLELTNLYSTFTDEYLENYKFVARTRREFIEFETSALQKIIEYGHNRKEFYSSCPHDTASTISAALRGLEQMLFVQEENIPQTAKNLIEIILIGLQRSS